MAALLWAAASASGSLTTTSVASHISVHPASGLADTWAASLVLRNSFGNRRPRVSYMPSLCTPVLEANVFFAAVASTAPFVAVATSELKGQSQVVGVAQVVLGRLRETTGVQNCDKTVAFIQNVAVSPRYRRRGVARQLVSCCEDAVQVLPLALANAIPLRKAAEAVADSSFCLRRSCTWQWRAASEAGCVGMGVWSWPAEYDLRELWLAVLLSNEAAIKLYTEMGYAPCEEWAGHVLMRKALPSVDPDADTPTVSTHTDSALLPAAAASVDGGQLAAPEPDALSTWPIDGLMPTSSDKRADESAPREVFDAALAGTELTAAAAPSDRFASEPLPRAGALAREVGVQLMYAAIAAFGVTVLLAPFGGPSVPQLLGLPGAAPWLPPLPLLGGAPMLGAWRPALDGAAGAALAMAELTRLGILPQASSGVGAGPLKYTQAQAEQMRPLFEICARCEAAVPAVLAIGVWQLAIAVAEELYYRGLLQSATRLLTSFLPASTPTLLSELLPLALASAAFGAVHVAFVGKPDPNWAAQGEDSAMRWFLVTAAYGAVYGMLFLLAGHRLEAPVCMHAGLNIGLCVRDWQRMRNTAALDLQRLFDEPSS